jgi:hypothetical protein
MHARPAPRRDPSGRLAPGGRACVMPVRTPSRRDTARGPTSKPVLHSLDGDGDESRVRMTQMCHCSARTRGQ